VTGQIPLVMHLVYRFSVGGLENGIVNLINRTDPAHFRHMVVALTHCEREFCRRIERPQVKFLSLRKPPGHGFFLYPRLAKLFAKYRPDILHTRNLAPLEAVIPAAWAHVPVRIHGEHGWDAHDPGGRSRRYRMVRRLYQPFVHHYVALSTQIERYLEDGVGVSHARISRICNGVDTSRFHPAPEGRASLAGSPFNAAELVVIGSVGRLQTVKDQVALVRAFAAARRLAGEHGKRLRLVMVGEGPLRREIEAEIATQALADTVWLAGERADIPEVMRSFDVFALPSRAEGISNTILEAMASGLPVLAFDVGGNTELVVDNATGKVTAAGDVGGMADMIAGLGADLTLRRQWGQAARMRAEAEFSLDYMVERYSQLYQSLLDAAAVRRSH
jgi:sugar transferase (PEP-CTERM/EpsH1 system associated)